MGSSDCEAGKQTRIAATRIRSRRCTTAFTKCVVPIITASTPWARSPTFSVNWRRLCTTPDITSCVVGTFTAATTVLFSTSTASVLVPPTSMPMRFML